MVGAQRLQHLPAEHRLPIHRKVAVETGITDPVLPIMNGADQRHQLLLELVKARLHLGGLHPRLEVVQQNIVSRFFVAGHAVDVAMLQLDILLQVGEEAAVVGFLARLRPRLLGQGRGRGVISARREGGTLTAFA